MNLKNLSLGRSSRCMGKPIYELTGSPSGRLFASYRKCMTKNNLKNIPIPSEKEVEKYLKLWNDSDVYNLSQKSLNNLFKTFPLNNNLDEILVKVCALDVIFSANAGRWFFEVSKHILSYDFDNKLKNNNIDVNDFATIYIKEKNKKRNFYSFASKYCSHHKPNEYPIYDSYVDEILWFFMKEELNNKRIGLKDYNIFRDTLIKFRSKFNLNKYSIKEIDQYIWLLGKEYFKRY